MTNAKWKPSWVHYGILGGVLLVFLVQADFWKSESRAPAPDYRVISVERFQIPVRIQRAAYKVVKRGPTPPRCHEIRPILKDVILNEMKRYPDTDEMIVWLYSSAAVSDGAVDVGMAIWSYEGNWGSVPYEMAWSNDRSAYRTKFQLNEPCR